MSWPAPKPKQRLWYWVRGDPLNSVRHIETSMDIDVATLQQLVAKKHGGKDTDFHFYRIPSETTLSLDKHYEADLGMLSISKLGQPLRATQKLKTMRKFQNNHLHLVVVIARPFLVTCWLRGTKYASLFSVELQKHAGLRELKTGIRELLPQLKSVPISDLTLCKLSTGEIDDLNILLDRRGEGDRLSSTCTVQDSFNNIPFSSQECRAIVEVENSDMALHCWVRGDKIDSVFSIEISSAKTVGDLKGVIKAHQSAKFREVDASDLDLYKVVLPPSEEDSPETVLGGHTISSVGTALKDLWKLQAIFSSLTPDEPLHLIIDCMVPLRCWVRGNPTSFSVKVSTRAVIDDLKNMISKLNPHLGLLPLKLYKISSACKGAELQGILESPGSGQLLVGDELMGTVLNDVPLSLRPRIVVEPLEASRPWWT